MTRDVSKSLILLATANLISCQLLGVQAARAQAMMEYGGLMAMPKGIPSPATVNAMTSPYRMVPGMTPQAASGSNSAMSVDALGNASIDPKKAAILGAKTVKEFEQAKAKMAAKPPDLKMAEALLRDAIGIRNSIWGYSDTAMPQMLTLLGDVYAQQKHTSQAESCYKNALIYITKQDGSGSYQRLDTLAKLGILYNTTGSQKEAVPFFQQVAQIKERQFGATSTDALKARLEWADVANAAGKAEAASLYSGLVETLDKVDRNKAGYSEIQTRLVKSYAAMLTKNGKADEAAAIQGHFTASEPASVVKDDKQTDGQVTIESKVTGDNKDPKVPPTANTVPESTPMTIEQKLQGEASADKQSKKKTRNN